MVLVEARTITPLTITNRGERLQRWFGEHFDGLQVVPRERAHRLPAIVEDLERRRLNIGHLKAISAKDPHFPYAAWAEDNIMSVLTYLKGFCMPDEVSTHEVRRQIRYSLSSRHRMLHKLTNQLSGNRVFDCANAFNTFYKLVEDIELGDKLSDISHKMFEIANRNGGWDDDSTPLSDKVRRVQHIIDLAFEGLEMLSEGLPPKDEIVFVT